MTRSTDTPWLLKKPSAWSRKALALLLLVGQNFGVGQPGGVVDGNVQRFPSQPFAAATSVALTAPVAVKRWPIPWMRPSFLDRGGSARRTCRARSGSPGRRAPAPGDVRDRAGAALCRW